MTTDEIIQAEVLGLWYKDSEGYMKMFNHIFETNSKELENEKETLESDLRKKITTEEYFNHVKKSAYSVVVQEYKNKK